MWEYKRKEFGALVKAKEEGVIKEERSTQGGRIRDTLDYTSINSGMSPPPIFRIGLT